MTTASENIAIGYAALGVADAGEGGNVVIGNEAGNAINNSGSDHNVIIGINAGQGGSGAMADCVAIGRSSLTSTAANAHTGTIAIGTSALGNCTSGAGNLAIGYSALESQTTGGNNIGIGELALGDLNHADADENIAIGKYAGHNGSNNLTTGSANTLLGYGTGTSAVGAANQTVIGNAATGQADNSVTLGNASVDKVYMSQDGEAVVSAGGLGIGTGTTAPASGQVHITQTDTTGSGLYIYRALASGSTDAPLVNIRNNTDGDDQPVMRLDQRASNATVLELHHNEDDGNASDTMIDFDFTSDADVDGAFYCRFQDSSGTIGSITANGASAVAFNTSSDYRLKEDLKSISDAISTVNELKTYDFKWKRDGKRRDGLIAHEVQDILPYAVSGEKDAVTTKKYKDGVDSDGEDIWKEKEVIAPQGIDYGALVPVLIKAVQELSAKVEALENK